VQKPGTITEVLPKQGLVYSEKHGLSEVLCKPKIMPIKSMTYEKLEQLQKEAIEQMKKAKQEQEASDPWAK
jgi:BBSome-interacting protein 1